MSSLLFPVYKLSRENTQPENMCAIVFEEAKKSPSHKRVFMQKQPSERFFKKGAMRNFVKFTRKQLCRNLFFDKVKLCRFRLANLKHRYQIESEVTKLPKRAVQVKEQVSEAVVRRCSSK